MTTRKRFTIGLLAWLAIVITACLIAESLNDAETAQRKHGQDQGYAWGWQDGSNACYKNEHVPAENKQ